MNEQIDLSLLDEILDAGRDPDAEPEVKPAPVQAMEFEVQQHVLSGMLRKANYSIPTSDWVPVLRNFMIMVIPGKMRIIASTGEFTTILETTMVTTINSGMTLLPAAQFLEVVKVASSGTLHIRVEEDDRALVSVDRVQWEIPLHRQARYPKLPELAKAKLMPINREDLLRTVEMVRPVVCTDPKRASLRMVQIKNRKVTASDGYRFQQADLDTDLEVNIPATALLDLVRILKASALTEVELGQTEEKVVICDGQDVYWLNKTKDQFADAENFLLKPALYNNRELIVDRSALLEAVRHVRLAADPKTDAVGLYITHTQIAVSARSPDGTKSTEFIDVKWKSKERVVVVNHHHLTEMLTHHSADMCAFMLGDDTKSKRHPLLLSDQERGTVGMIPQMHSGRAIYDRLD